MLRICWFIEPRSICLEVAIPVERERYREERKRDLEKRGNDEKEEGIKNQRSQRVKVAVRPDCVIYERY